MPNFLNRGVLSVLMPYPDDHDWQGWVWLKTHYFMILFIIYFQISKPWSILLTFSFHSYLIWSCYRSYLVLLSVIYISITQFNFLFEWLENIIVYSQLSRGFLVDAAESLVYPSFDYFVAHLHDYRKNLKEKNIYACHISCLSHFF